MTIKSHQFDHLVTKLELKTRDSGDLLAWFEVNGKVVTRTRRSKGSGDLPMQHSIRQQLKLNESEFKEAISCHISRDEYIDILKKKGIL